ncbi:sensor histidine kinase [Jiulongibacter sp. NS-SX5]|uniref:sensor histidine kinase n=1 Tax=Jiulongibacter sp. NS-SX5 TaxID=3463854 RepID=UPI004058E97D
MFQRTSRSSLFHIITWLFIFSLPFLNYIFKPDELLDANVVLMFVPLLFTAFLCLIFYTNLLLVAPKLLNRTYWWLYILMVILGYVIFYYYNVGVFKFIIIPQIPESERPKPAPNEEWRNAFRYALPFLFYVVTLLISNILHFLSEQRREKELNRKIEFQRVEAELNMLKLQISPHFLFNTLNNIRWLVRKKSDDSEESIIKLSEVLRYIIYEVNSEKVSVKQEADHLRNFISLHTLRIAAEAKITFEVEPAVEMEQVAPLLYIHFVENAFKYGVDGKNTPEIEIHISKTQNGVFFTCRNKILNPGNSLENEGVGISNVKRRLELLYPDQYELSITEQNDYFDVSLELDTHVH